MVRYITMNQEEMNFLVGDLNGKPWPLTEKQEADRRWRQVWLTKRVPRLAGAAQ